MKIDIWYDFVCPFCYLGETKLEMALKAFGDNAAPVELNFHSFQLSPFPAHFTEDDKEQRRLSMKSSHRDIHQLIADKYGITYEQSKANNDRIVASAQAVGLNYRFDILKPGNTEKAHIIAQYAKHKGLDHALILSLYSAYFEAGADLDDTEQLIALAQAVGLDAEEVRNQLSSPELLAAVNADQAAARKLGITGVPYFIFNDKYAVSGAQGVEVFMQALNKAAEKD